MATVITTTSREWRDLDLNFAIHPVRKDINKHRAEFAVINSIKNLILNANSNLNLEKLDHCWLIYSDVYLCL